MYLERVLQQIVESVRGARGMHFEGRPPGRPAVEPLPGEGEQARELLQVELGGQVYSLICWSRQAAPESTCLSPREREVVRLVANGLPNKTIASRLHISAWTVATYMRRIFTKLEVNSRAEMVAKALRQGVLSQADLGAPR
jgi:DNA-binding CsgD family transcriptional regulator